MLRRNIEHFLKKRKYEKKNDFLKYFFLKRFFFFSKEVFLKISQILLENTCVGVIF